MLMPTAGSNFNASDVLQFKLIKAAKERNNNQGNTISRNIESIKKTPRFEENSDGNHERKKLKNNLIKDYSSDEDNQQNNGDGKYYNKCYQNHVAADKFESSDKESNYTPKVKISSSSRKRPVDSLSVLKNRKISKAVRRKQSARSEDEEC